MYGYIDEDGTFHLFATLDEARDAYRRDDDAYQGLVFDVQDHRTPAARRRTPRVPTPGTQEHFISLGQ